MVELWYFLNSYTAVCNMRKKLAFNNLSCISVAIASGVNPTFQKDQDILVLPLDLQQFETHHDLANNVVKQFGKVMLLLLLL